jgi:hypothetical protein
MSRRRRGAAAAMEVRERQERHDYTHWRQGLGVGGGMPASIAALLRREVDGLQAVA